jgi:hypothetical protein
MAKVESMRSPQAAREVAKRAAETTRMLKTESIRAVEQARLLLSRPVYPFEAKTPRDS